jgi:hypothetical protein
LCVQRDKTLLLRRGFALLRLGPALAWLEQTFAEGPVAVRELRKAAAAAGYPWMTVRRAKSRVGAIAKRSGFGAEGGWQWSLERAEEPGGETAPSDLAKGDRAKQ